MSIKNREVKIKKNKVNIFFINTLKKQMKRQKRNKNIEKNL